MILLLAAYRATRRAMERDQHRVRTDVALWRLLLEEVALLIRRVGRWKVTTVALSVSGTVLAAEVALTESTPGPVLAAPLRWVVAVLAAAVVVAGRAVAHAVRRSR